MVDLDRPVLPYSSAPSMPPKRSIWRPLAKPAAVVLIIGGSIFWLLFFWVGPMAAIDSHFTSRPETVASFRLGPWRPDPTVPVAANNSARFVREATWDLLFFRLRYIQPKQVAVDGTEETLSCEGYYAEPRWTAYAAMSAYFMFCIMLFGASFWLRRR